MAFIRKLLGADLKVDENDAKRAEETQRILDNERDNFRQALSRVDKQTRIMNTWANANKMLGSGE